MGLLQHIDILYTWIVIGDFRVAFCLCFKASPSVKPFIWKLVLLTCKWTTISLLLLLYTAGTDEVFSGTACEGAKLSLDCTKFSKTIQILYTFFGAYPYARDCGANYTNTTCQASGVKEKVVYYCQDYRQCSVPVIQSYFSHVCPSGVKQSLEIYYQCTSTTLKSKSVMRWNNYGTYCNYPLSAVHELNIFVEFLFICYSIYFHNFCSFTQSRIRKVGITGVSSKTRFCTVGKPNLLHKIIIHLLSGYEAYCFGNNEFVNPGLVTSV